MTTQKDLDARARRILKIIPTCRDCPHRVYYSGGRYECYAAFDGTASSAKSLPEGHTKNAPIPDWCPLEPALSSSRNEWLPIERHSQARWFAMCVAEAGPSLPSRQKWMGIHGLAIKFLELLESDPSSTPEPSSSVKPDVITEDDIEWAQTELDKLEQSEREVERADVVAFLEAWADSLHEPTQYHYDKRDALLDAARDIRDGDHIGASGKART